MAGKVCLSEFALDVCDDGMGNCLIAVLQPTVLPLQNKYSSEMHIARITDYFVLWVCT